MYEEDRRHLREASGIDGDQQDLRDRLQQQVVEVEQQARVNL